MSDVRALLKAKRQEARIQHPYASYTSTGQLRCTVCDMVVKQASAWVGHVGSKAHRENAKQRISQAIDQQEETTRSVGKRKVGEDDTLDNEEIHPTSESKKRKVTPEDPSKPAPGHLTSTFPSDFFSDPSRAPLPSADDDSSDEDEGNPAPMPPTVTDNPIDPEWQRFQQEMLTPAPAPTDHRHETFKRATVFAEPELLPENMSGLPTREPLDVGAVVVEVPKTEEELRKRKETDEKELIMDRLLEEERAQEEADAKVVLLKGRLDALKKRRNEAKAARAKKL